MPESTDQLCAIESIWHSAPRREHAEALEHLGEEEAEPDALAAAAVADQVHAVVPVAAAHQRQAVDAEAQAMLEGATRMLVQVRRLGRMPGQVVVRLVVRI